ncbi:MAG: septation regulator SpoVG [Clostridium sp.]
MNITRIRVKKVNEEKVKAIVSISIDDSILIHDIKVIDGKNGIFISMPKKKTKTGDYRDLVHPVSQEAREELYQKILEAYENAEEEKIEE